MTYGTIEMTTIIITALKAQPMGLYQLKRIPSANTHTHACGTLADTLFYFLSVYIYICVCVSVCLCIYIYLWNTC